MLSSEHRFAIAECVGGPFDGMVTDVPCLEDGTVADKRNVVTSHPIPGFFCDGTSLLPMHSDTFPPGFHAAIYCFPEGHGVWVRSNAVRSFRGVIDRFVVFEKELRV